VSTGNYTLIYLWRCSECDREIASRCAWIRALAVSIHQQFCTQCGGKKLPMGVGKEACGHGTQSEANALSSGS